MPGHHAILNDLMPDGSQKARTFSLKQLIGRQGAIMMSSVDLLQVSTSINAKDVETGQTLLEHACRSSDISLAKYTARHGANLGACTASGETPLNLATKKRAYELMHYLVSSGVSVNSGDAEGRAPVHVATEINDADGVCRLLEWGAYINTKDKEGITPLHIAAMHGHYTLAELILELGANLNVTDKRGYTAVAHAEANDHFKLMDRLIALGGKGAEGGSSLPVKGGLDLPAEKTAKGVKLGDITLKPLYLAKRSSLSRLAKFRI